MLKFIPQVFEIKLYSYTTNQEQKMYFLTLDGKEPRETLYFVQINSASVPDDFIPGMAYCLKKGMYAKVTTLEGSNLPLSSFVLDELFLEAPPEYFDITKEVSRILIQELQSN